MLGELCVSGSPDYDQPLAHFTAACGALADPEHSQCLARALAGVARCQANPKLPSLCVDICALTCDNAEESKVFMHRKSATMTGYHDGSLRWSGHVARRHYLRAREGPGQRREWCRSEEHTSEI